MMFLEDDDYFCTEIQLAARKHLMRCDDIECNRIRNNAIAYLVRVGFDNINNSFDELNTSLKELNWTIEKGVIIHVS